MKWQHGEESKNVEDRRGSPMAKGLVLGGGGSILILLIGLLFGLDPAQLKTLTNIINAGKPPASAGTPGKVDPKDEPLREFTSKVFRFNEDVWEEQFKKLGKKWVAPRIVFFDGQVSSACGVASAQVGPFYCPGDQIVYIDFSFYREMETKLKAGGEFARAYVIAHEVGHHVQNLLGFSRKSGDSSETDNERSVRLELQADYLAGVWAHHCQEKYDILERGDIESALNAANQIGDDALQRKSTGQVRPDSFTHGTSAQRAYWFKEGLKSGSVTDAALLFKIPYSKL